MSAEKTCAVCGRPAEISDGIVGADLCARPFCFDVAWARAFDGYYPDCPWGEV